jgi:hypothetical protein
MNKFFFDRCISEKIVEALKCLDVSAIHHSEVFDHDAKDVDWIPEVGANGWILVTCDDRIRKRPAERRALADADIVSVFIWREFPRKGRWEQALWMVKYWQAIAKKAGRADAGTAFYVNGRGKIDEIN